MTRAEIVAELARGRVVEEMTMNIAHAARLRPDLEDLSQMVYVVILEYDEDKIMELWERGEIRFFIARIIINQYRSGNSKYYRLYKQYGEKAQGYEGHDRADDA